MSTDLGNIYIWVFLVNSENALVLAFVKKSCITILLKTVFFVLLEAKNPWFVIKNCSKSSYIWVFILSKKQHNSFYKNVDNSGMVGSRNLSDPSLNCIFNALIYALNLMN